MSETIVVNVKHSSFDEYIGRACYGYRESALANPFKVGLDGTRKQVIEKYEKRLRSRPDLLALLPALKGKRLGCWCHPKPCHGDVIVKLIERCSDTLSLFQ